MVRPGDGQAGFTLLDDLRDQADRNEADLVPCVLYTASASPDQKAEAQRRGALGETASPAELVRLVTAGLTGQTG
jgi:hypothetical protein